MRPLALAVEGFTSFRDRLELDFSSLDLFAITGPTGVGKSSLIDAVVFALYGQVPRVGDDYKQLISHGAERLSVLFDFAAGEERYRIARTARRTGASQQRLERRGATGWESLSDKAKEIRTEVERILGLDYDGFTRSVVLPQGRFDAFLKGEPKERRKILVALLGLGVYERMQQLANQKSVAARAEVDFIRRQLETDYADATAARLDRLRAELARAEAEAVRAEAALAAVAEGAALAQEARAARRDLEAASRGENDERRALAEAEALVEGARASQAALAAQLEELEQQQDASVVDEARLARLLGAKPRVEQLVAQRTRCERLARERVDKRRALAEAKHALAAAEAELPAAEQAERAARGAEAELRTAREKAHREHAAVALRRGLKPGERCPVCAQAVASVPEGEAPGLDAADRRAREAEKAARAAAESLQQQRLRLERLRASVESLEGVAAQLAEQDAEAASALEAAVAELGRAGFPEEETADATSLAALLGAEIEGLDAARRRHAELETQRRQNEQRRAQLESSLAVAGARAATARSRIASLGQERALAEARLGEVLQALLALGSREGWPDLAAPPTGRDEAELLEGVRAAAQRASAEGGARVATLRQSVQANEKAIERVAELGERRKRLEGEAMLHKQLSDLLRGNELVAWIQEEALGQLAAAASRHLARLSQKRYELRLGAGEGEKAPRAEQDFFVADHWNLGSVRSVRTLSGGETFLASLALALALAESIAQLSSQGRTADALDSLFLDEGFGSLDAETLDVVVSALDALHGGERMVGIVTHVRELAERLPARVEVRRLDRGPSSTASVV